MMSKQVMDWMETRKRFQNKKGWKGAYCQHCCYRLQAVVNDEKQEWCSGFSFVCPLEEPTYRKIKDAAEFEARVALWLLDHDFEDVPCAHGMDIFCPRPRPPFVDNGCGKWCLLRCARLAVEQEIDGE